MSQTGHSNQFALLKQRRFAPFFWTQFLGAGNDNLPLCRVNLFTKMNLDWLLRGGASRVPVDNFLSLARNV